jgi:hypothetical protein
MYSGTSSAETRDESGLREDEEIEQAANLLEVVNDVELDRYLGQLIHKAGVDSGVAVTSALGRPLGGLLKGIAKTLLPVARSLRAPRAPAGVRPAGALFGIELEGLSPEDQEYQVAQRFVRFATEATRQALQAGRRMAPARAARNGLMAAARRHAPGLLRPRPRRPWPPAIAQPIALQPVVQPVAVPSPEEPAAPAQPPEEPSVSDTQPDQAPATNGGRCGCSRCAAKGRGWYRRGRDLIVTNVFPSNSDPTGDSSASA